jgi:hypothetical protein
MDRTLAAIHVAIQAWKVVVGAILLGLAGWIAFEILLMLITLD